ncbi:hypothetical protein DCAR_0624426 [Daucus carota subsp. sativus]|uniref:F-box protein At3g26010-like beta-propeller domain-containing protein n=2 Tax=Daucus carota subsp. sativus TaxID=79200 RepID=A0A164VU10_DAUCS|nr:hypothetical protein DCAR_0624426 [Daucus carota subsp. sativus]
MLAFDPSVSSHYKIVRLPLFEEENLFLEFDIFCSETGVWVRRAVQVNESNSLCGLSLVKNSAYLDGVLYRLLSFNSRKLVSIDLNNIDSVIVRVIDLPVVHKLAVPGCIGVSRRNIYYAYREPQSFNIWHLNEAADWVLNYELSTRKFEAYIVRKFNVQSDETVWLSPYAMHPTDDIVFIGTGDMIFALYLETSTLRLAYSTDSLTCVPGLFHPIFVYISCPVPLNNFRPVTTQKVLWSCKGEVLVTDGDVCSDNPEQCGILPEMDKFVNGVSPEFWVMPTIRSIGLKHVDVTGVGHLLHPSYKGPKF